MWISKTPLRASFLGGGTDYPSYFRDHPGAVLGSTIDKYVYISALPMSGVAEQKYRITYRTTESVQSIDEIRHPVIREVLREQGYQAALNIATMSDLPGSTGLGSSSAFTVGFINLLNKMSGKDLTRYELARQAIHLEQDVLKENVGVQDQIHAAFGGMARYEFSENSFSIEPLRLSTRRMNFLNSSMLLVYTGVQRSASVTLQSQEQRTKLGDNAAYLREMYEMTKIGAVLLEEEGDDLGVLQRFAELLDHGWQLKRQLGNVSSGAIDQLYLEGKELGARGGKLLGAGGGGFVLFLVDPDLHPAFIERFGAENVIPIKMTNGGSDVVNMS